MAADAKAVGAARSVRPKFLVVMQLHPLWPSMAPLRDAATAAAVGDSVAFAVPLNTPLFTRLLTLATLRLHRRRAVRALRSSGADVVTCVGVDPSLSHPSWFYELDTAASAYTDCYMRPRGSHVAARRIAQRWFGCDPSLGGVMVVGKKSC